MIRRLLLALLCALAVQPAHAGLFPSRYDDDIRQSVKRYWPDFRHWLAWKAQLYQESRLDPEAVSPAGAMGLAQFMPGTWRDVARQLRLGEHASPFAAELSIEAGAYYMAALRRQWSAPRPALDRHWLAAASYNAGLGSLLAAQRACGGRNLYAEIVACLPAITGHHSRETLAYVERIKRWWKMMRAGLSGG